MAETTNHDARRYDIGLSKPWVIRGIARVLKCDRRSWNTASQGEQRIYASRGDRIECKLLLGGWPFRQSFV
jgi:hypothetical protein